jgi:hypothetical protein
MKHVWYYDSFVVGDLGFRWLPKYDQLAELPALFTQKAVSMSALLVYRSARMIAPLLTPSKVA